MMQRNQCQRGRRVKITAVVAVSIRVNLIYFIASLMQIATSGKVCDDFIRNAFITFETTKSEYNVRVNTEGHRFMSQQSRGGSGVSLISRFYGSEEKTI